MSAAPAVGEWRCALTATTVTARRAVRGALRGEEDDGRWELLRAGRTTRGRATARATGGLARGWLVLWTLSAALTVATGARSTVGFSTSGSLLFATAATADAAMFLAIGALCSRLTPTRRQANALAAAMFTAAYLTRLIADSVPAPAGCAGPARSAGSRSCAL